MPTDPVHAIEDAAAPEEAGIEGTRMAFGDHLDELRGCLIRALLGVSLTAVFTLIYGKEILGYIFQPLLVVQVANGLPATLQVLAPTDAFTAYLKISLLSALIVAMPWVLHQAWRFIAIGLYAREQRFVRGVVWASSGLFIVGVLFLYYLVLPLVLQFFITFNRAFEPADLSPHYLQSLLIPAVDAPASVASTEGRVQLKVLTQDPLDPNPGDVWVNSTTRRLVLRTGSEGGGVWSIPFEIGAASHALQSQFAVDQYISFVLLLALSFGLTFETPVVVVFLAWSGLVSATAMSSSRRYVLMATIVASAILTPTADLLNQALLAGPMYVLFELGLFIAKRVERKRAM